MPLANNGSSTPCDKDTMVQEVFCYHMKIHRISYLTNLIIASFNIKSIRNKFTTVNHILGNGYPAIFRLLETNLNESFRDGQFHIENHDCHREDRACNGGCLMLYMRSDIHKAAELT